MIHSVFAAATKPEIHSVTTSPGAPKNNMKTEDGGKAEDSGLSSDQLVPDYAAGLVISPFVSINTTCMSTASLISLLHERGFYSCFICFGSVLFGQQDETKNVSDGRPQTISLPSDNCE